jgi:amino acid adenylation domain-containing protein
MMVLHQGFVESSSRYPDRPAVKESAGTGLTYRELDALTDRARDALVSCGVTMGDRVGVYLPKSADSVAVILGALKAGAAYVPVDPGSPTTRAAYILHDCTVRVIVTETALVASLQSELNKLGGGAPVVIALDGVGGGSGLAHWLDALGAIPRAETVRPPLDDPAYILYTSGSTGKPKGVVVSHRAAVSFVDWCSATFAPTPDDRYSSHAPFHFDLSIHDLYVSLKHGASVVLIGEDLGKDPRRLAALIEAERLTIWYSTPSILSLLEEHGRLERYDCRSLRIVLFAGEVFPVPRLRQVMNRWPWPRFCNLYGPTETNVCTWHEVPRPLPPEWTEPLPVGRPCAHYRPLVVEGDRPVAPGERGELLMSGPGIMTGYWNLPDQNARAFMVGEDGVRWYRTGDVVSEQPDGTFLFHGRRDRMVKRRGYRIELGEIESGLARHPAIAAAAVVARPDEASGVIIHAFLAPRGRGRPSIVDLKRFCMEALPAYMAPDRFTVLDTIPQTSTDKTDYQALLALARERL